jgi:hypothetical protein
MRCSDPSGNFPFSGKGKKRNRVCSEGSTKTLSSFLIAFFSVLWLIPLLTGGRGEVIGAENATTLSIPRELGDVVFRYNEHSTNQLFIIGMNHRDAITKMNGSSTAKAQADAYRIGEWLVQNEGIELILPEGFFEKKKGTVTKAAVSDRTAASARAVQVSDRRSIEEQLADHKTYVNAEMLLRQNFLLQIQQVEDEALYDAVGERLLKLSTGSFSFYDSLCLKSEIDYLQERRTAAMLQNIPETIEKEFREGTIKSKKALFTIGLSHIPEVVNYLNQNRIAVYCPLHTSLTSGNYIADLNIAKADFGVTIIIPRTIADDGQILARTRVDKVIAESARKVAAKSGRSESL